MFYSHILKISYFLNHSCDPGVFCDDVTYDYIANRNIKTGEELTIDVEALMKKHIFSFECHCGSKNCRKIVRI